MNIGSQAEQQLVSVAAALKQAMPTFSGNFENYLINQLCELKMLNSLVKSPKSQISLQTSALWPLFSEVHSHVESQFNYPASLALSDRIKVAAMPGDQKLIGCLITLKKQRGSVANGRTDFGGCHINSEFYLAGGKGVKVFSDVRSVQLTEDAA